MALIDAGPLKADALLIAYKTHLRHELTEQLMPVAKEIVHKAVDQALKALEQQIQIAYLDYKRELIVKLTINDKEIR